jgi:hypothetical protein
MRESRYKKNDKIHIPISSEDKLLLKKRAEQCRMDLCDYCRFILLNAKPEVQLDT